MSITGGITIDSASRTIKVTGLSRATVVQILHDRRWLAQANSFPLQQNTMVAPESATLFAEVE